MTEATKRTRRPKGEGSIYFDSSKNRWRGTFVDAGGTRRRVSAASREECEARVAELHTRPPAPAEPRPPRAAPGDGSVYYDTSKETWRGAYTLPDGSRRRVSAPSRTTATVKLREAQARYGSGGALDDDRTVAEFLNWWLDVQDNRWRSGEISQNTASNYRWALAPVIDRLGAKRLTHLSPGDVEWLLGELPGMGRPARNSITRVKSVLGKALDAALARGQITRNVARLAEKPATPPTPERRSLTPDQAKALLETAKGTDVEAFLTVGLYLGLRPGELLGLTWDAIDLDGHILEVRASMKREPRYNGQAERQRLGDVKTRRSRRTLDLAPPVVAALRAHRTRQLETQLAAGPVWSNPDRLVFTTNHGTPVPPSNMNKALGEVTEAAGLGHWSMTELSRHSAASLMSDAGVPLEAIADVLGHESTRMLERHYRHPLRPTLSAHVGPLSAVLGGANGD